MENKPWKLLLKYLDQDNRQELQEYIDSLSPGEVARAMAHLSHTDQRRLLTGIDVDDAADLIEDLSDAQAIDIVEHLSPSEAAAILNEMESDEQADIIGELDDEDAEAILSRMLPDEADDVRKLIAYPADVAGGLMITEYLAFNEKDEVSHVLKDLGENSKEYEDYNVQYLYITGSNAKLQGVLPLRSLILSPPDTRLEDIMIKNPYSVSVETKLDVLADIFEDRMYLGIPVVNEFGILLGVVLRQDVDEALNERMDEDHMKSQGIIGGEELRTMPVLFRSKRRLSWLSVNILLNILSASVIAYYQDTLSQVIALAVFLPIISDMSGCSGNQAVAISMRELALGIVRPYEVVRVWVQEVSVGVVNGLVLGGLIALVAYIWKGNIYLGIVVGSALALNTVVAVSIGGVIPLVLKKFNKDPALSSGPILTTITDMCGFAFALGLATMMLDKL